MPGSVVEVTNVMQVVPHVYATIWATLIVIGLSLFVFFFYKKKANNKKPGNFQTIIETSFESFENNMKTTAGTRLSKAYPYFFTLFIYIIFSTMMELFGFVNPAGSIAFTLALGIVTFIGIYVIGIFTQGFWHFVKHKYINPIEIIGQFSPLISISVRLFGATFAGSLLGQVLIIILSSFLTSAPMIEAIPFINLAIQWIMFFITIVFGGLQAYVFVSLTMIYWNQELGDKKERKATKKAEKEKLKLQTKNNKQISKEHNKIENNKISKNLLNVKIDEKENSKEVI